MLIENKLLKDYDFLRTMYNDGYFPDFLVDEIKLILLNLCKEIEQNKAQDTDALLALSHAATDDINNLQEEFYANDSEIETGAREAIAENFAYIAKAYGFIIDTEELIATRDW